MIDATATPVPTETGLTGEAAAPASEEAKPTVPAAEEAKPTAQGAMAQYPEEPIDRPTEAAEPPPRLSSESVEPQPHLASESIEPPLHAASEPIEPKPHPAAEILPADHAGDLVPHPPADTLAGELPAEDRPVAPSSPDENALSPPSTPSLEDAVMPPEPVPGGSSIPPRSQPTPAAAAYVAPGMVTRERAETPRRSVVPAVLGIAVVVLLAALLGLIYAGPQLTGAADLATRVDALTQRVATLEARPQPAPVAEPVPPVADIGAIETRSKSLESEVGDLKTALADLTTKLDAVTQQAAADGAKIASLEQTASAPAQTPAATSPSSPPSSAATPAAQSPTAETPAGAVPPSPAEAPPGAMPAVSSGSAQAPVVATAADLTALSGRLDELAQRVAALPTPAPVDLGPMQSRIADLAQRIDATQASVAALPKVDPQAIEAHIAGVSGKVAETDQHIGAVAAAVAALPKIDLAPLQASIAEVDKRLTPIEAALSAPKDGDRVTEARAEGSAEETRAAPLAVVAGAVSRALDAGRPFGPEIDALHGLGFDDAALGPLPGLAATGAPTLDALKDQWAAVENDVLTASGPKTGDGVLDRFAAGARSLVQVRRVGAASGDDASAVSSRITAALERGDLAGALAEWAKLPASSQAASKAWAEAVRSRLDAGSEANSLLARAVAVLAKAKG